MLLLLLESRLPLHLRPHGRRGRVEQRRRPFLFRRCRSGRSSVSSSAPAADGAGVQSRTIAPSKASLDQPGSDRSTGPLQQTSSDTRTHVVMIMENWRGIWQSSSLFVSFFCFVVAVLVGHQASAKVACSWWPRRRRVLQWWRSAVRVGMILNCVSPVSRRRRTGIETAMED